MSKIIAFIPYSKVVIIWVSNYYDLALSGICCYNKKLCRFETNYETMEVSIYNLTIIEKIKWKKRQKLFEWCIGYHWTYPYRKQGHKFYYRWPKWFWKIIFKLYYKF